MALQHTEVPYHVISPEPFTSQDVDSHAYLFPESVMYSRYQHHNTPYPQGENQSNQSLQSGSFSYMDPTYLPLRPSSTPNYQPFVNTPLPIPEQQWASFQASSKAPVGSGQSTAPPLSPPPTSKSPKEPQIRMSSQFYDFGRRRHESLPLDTSAVRK